MKYQPNELPIQILPARLANQIAAGEVVERPASVVKELIENSIDAGADVISVTIDKGGAKRIKITDNGCGIKKDELTLALSRHATSKIANLSDLEAIESLGFRGEALASISSVARLTLTSKPASQETAWQAAAEGRDMAVKISPAAHPNGTTIDVQDLFFNTPARRKFLRTEKTEFTHIEETVKRIALTNFNVSFTLVHNGKTIKTYRAINNEDKTPRIAAICGKKFIDNAFHLEAENHELRLEGWVAKPTFNRLQNDLCYSYVNGRMMRDKLINHAIRQAFSPFLPDNSYPAFVLYLTLNPADVDINVHPAKHEVRFHQGRYVHDFIFSVVNNMLVENGQSDFPELQEGTYVPAIQSTEIPKTPLQFASQSNNGGNPGQYKQKYSAQRNANETAVSSYQTLMTPVAEAQLEKQVVDDSRRPNILSMVSDSVALIELNRAYYLLPINNLDSQLSYDLFIQRWQEKSVSQPLLLPVSITLENELHSLVNEEQVALEHLGFVYSINGNACVIRQCPVQFRSKNVVQSFERLLREFHALADKNIGQTERWCTAMSQALAGERYTLAESKLVMSKAENSLGKEKVEQLILKSYQLDLTSAIRKAIET